MFKLYASKNHEICFYETHKNCATQKIWIYVTIHEKIDHFVQKLKIEIIILLYSAKRAEYADIFVFFCD